MARWKHESQGDTDPDPMAHCSRSVITTTDIDGVSTMITNTETLVNIDYSDYIVRKLPSAIEKPLPIQSHRASILKSIKINQVTIIEGSTGCGKTTQVPQFIMDEMMAEHKQFNIVCTQPRRIAASSVAKRVCDERGWELGELIGYQVGMDRVHVGPNTRLRYCTTGVLLQRIISEKRIDQFSHIIIDEIHERDIENDLLVMVIRKLMWAKPCDVKLILMSATFETEKLIDYFTLHPLGESVNQTFTGVRPFKISIENKPHDLREFYINTIPVISSSQNLSKADFILEEPTITPGVYEACQTIIRHLDTLEKTQPIQTGEKGAILIFLPGLHEIYAMMDCLNNIKNCKLWVLPLHSSINFDDQRKVFQKPNKGNRKVILATNIAESSITVPDIEYVIDFCLTKNLVVDPITNYPCLELQWASHANCKQRAGRAGRTKAGRVFRLVYESFYKQLPKYPEAEITRTPLELAVLRVKRLDMGSPKNLLGLCIDPPKLKGIQTSVLRLKRIGGLTIQMEVEDESLERIKIYSKEDGDMTTMGNIMASLPIDVQLSKLIILGHCLGCVTDCVIIAGCLSVKTMFSKPIAKDIESYKMRLMWAEATFSDLFVYMHAYKKYLLVVDAFESNEIKIQQWCDSVQIQYKRIREVHELIEELKKRLEYFDMKVEDAPNRVSNQIQNELILKIAICGAFYPHYFTRQQVLPDTLARCFFDHDPFSSVELQSLPHSQGVLYSNQIRDLLKVCGDGEKVDINIDFEDTKAVVTFTGDCDPVESKASTLSRHLTSNMDEQDKEKMNKIRDTTIKNAVYVAVKLRMLGIQLKLNVFPELEAKRRMEEIKKSRYEFMKNSQRMPTNRFIVNNVPHLMTPLISLPPLNLGEIDIFISHIVSCGQFWAVYKDDNTKQVLNKIRRSLTAYTGKTVESPILGMLVMRTEHIGNRSEFSRGRVIGFDGNQVRFFDIDHGVTDYVEKKNLNIITTDGRDTEILVKIPGQAFECRLANIKPNELNNLRGTWTKESRDWFVDNVSNKTLKAEVYSVVNRVVNIQLYRKSDDGQWLNINQELIEKSFAVTAEEPAPSKLNHDLRRQNRNAKCSNSSIDYDNRCYEVLRPYGDDKLRSGLKQKLSGPSSPLEVHFNSLITGTTGRVKIERDSVNSVSLESDPAARYSRLLVAGTLSTTVEEKQIVARDTTLMPSIRGLPSIMCLLFAHHCQLFKDPKHSIYYGALCGLGGRVVDGYVEVYDRDGDISVEFDAAFTNSDIAEINTIRFRIDDLLKDNLKKMASVGSALFARQDKIRSKLMNILQRRRISLSDARESFNMRWFDQEELRDKSNKTTEDSHDKLQAFLPLHRINRDGIDIESWCKAALNQNDILKQVLEK